MSSFRPQSFHRLHNYLLDIFINPSNLKDLYLELNKFNLKNPLHLPLKNNDEKSQLLNGNATIAGVLHKVNNDFIDQSIKLSNILNISENLSSSLLHHGLHSASRFQRSPLESSVLLFHSERLYLIKCLQLIVSASVDESIQNSNIQIILLNFTNQLIQNNFIQTLVNHIKSINKTNSISNDLPDEINFERIKFIDVERQELSHLLYLFAFLKFFKLSDITSCFNYASTLDSNDPISPFILSTLLASLSINSNDIDFLTSTFNSLSKTSWSSNSFKSVVLLKFSLFLVSNFQLDPKLALDSKISEDDVESTVVQAINDDAFVHLQQILVNIFDIESTFDENFKPHLLYQFDLFLTSFITILSPILRKLKHREEDLILASSRSRSFNVDNNNSKQHLAQLYFLVALLYRFTPPESALKFWLNDNEDLRLFSFLRWSAEARTPSMVHAFFEMLGSLANGNQCATYVYEFLTGIPDINENSLCSWSALFGALDFYATNLMKLKRENDSNANIGGEIPPDEVSLLKSFLLVLKQVVNHSSIARASLYDNSNYKPIQTLFSLLTCPIPFDLKSSLFDTLSAFASPLPVNIITEGSSSLSVDCAKKIWQMLEQSQILPTLKKSKNVHVQPLSGIIAELEEIESQAGTYPISIAFINLLNNLIHTPAKSLTLRKGIEINSLTIPNGLGANHRIPGIEPYVNFVIEDMLLKINQRGFKNPSERWKLTETSLCFVEKCLSSYDLSQLFVDNTINIGSVAEVVANSSDISLCSLVLHPGFNILNQFLSGGPILNELFSVIGIGIDALLDNRFKTPLYSKCIQRCLRIIYRILSIQNMFIEVLLPLLKQQSNIIPGIGKINIPSNLSALDQHMLFNHESVIQIALYVNATDEETSLLSVKIISSLANSPYFSTADGFGNHYKRRMNRLTGIIDSSDESLRILSGFVNLLEIDSPLDINEVDDNDDIETILNSSADHKLNLNQLIRNLILDLLIENTNLNSTSPNVAHFLLGFNLQQLSPSEIEIEDPLSQNSKVSCLHVILNLVNKGIDNDEIEFYIKNPILAEKCYRLIYQLCTNDLTSKATIRYLRNNENFFYNQLINLPVNISSIYNSNNFNGLVKYSDGSILETSSIGLSSFLRFRAWLMDTIALELHSLTNSGQFNRVKSLVEILFSTSNEISNSDDLVNEFGEQLINESDYDQSLPKILEIYQSLDLDYVDEINSIDNLNISFFQGLDLSSCLKVDDNGSLIYDFRSLLSILGVARRNLQKSGVIASPTQHEQVKIEMKQILEFIASDNRRRQVHHSRQFNLESWRRLLDIILSKCFEIVKTEKIQNVLLHILQTILPKLILTDTAPATTELLCGATLSIINKLKQIMFNNLNNNEINIESDLLFNLPFDRLLVILKYVVEAIIKPGSTVIVRGNLYSVLHNYLQILSLQNQYNEHESKVIETESQIIIDSISDKLLPIIARDGIDGSEVWKTVAFSVLDSILSLSIKNNSLISLNILVKHGFLRNFIQSIKDSEDVLIYIIQNDPESLNPLYVFESKMAFLLRIAQCREGSEKLLDCQLFSILAQCEFISCRPSGEETIMDYDSFIPPSTERYHQLLLPTLQLISTVISNVGSTSTIAAKDAVGFVYGHKEILLEILRDNPALTSLSLVKEHHLIVCILEQVQNAIDDEELISSSGFAPFHTAILNLSTKYMTRSNWIDRIVPLTDSERDDAQTYVQGNNELSKFTIIADLTVEDVNEWILNYLTLSRKVGTNFRPVLIPIFPQIKEGNEIQQTSLPSLGQSIIGLKELVSSFTGTLFDYREHKFKLQQQQNSSQQLKVMLNNISKVLKSRLTRIEMMLLLIWRHVDFYIKVQKSSPNPSLTASLSRSYNNQIDSKKIANECNSLIIPILNKLDQVEFTNDMIGSDSKSRQAFIAIICRRLKEVIMLSTTSINDKMEE